MEIVLQQWKKLNFFFGSQSLLLIGESQSRVAVVPIEPMSLIYPGRKDLSFFATRVLVLNDVY